MIRYLPFLNGNYTVKPGLKAISNSAGIDKNIFQFDENVEGYLKNKDYCREEGIKKYYCEHKLNTQTSKTINKFIIEQLLYEYPNFFNLNKGNKKLICKITGDEITLLDNGEADYPGKYISLFDALCCQIQEDIAIIRFESTIDWLATVHLCAPNHWSPLEKIGHNFDEIHEPIPGLEKMRRHYLPMLKSILTKARITGLVGE